MTSPILYSRDWLLSWFWRLFSAAVPVEWYFVTGWRNRLAYWLAVKAWSVSDNLIGYEFIGQMSVYGHPENE